MNAHAMLQLNPPIPVDTPKGSALAMLLIDYGPELDLMWVTFIDETGECWTWPNPKIRAQKNVSLGRRTDPVATPKVVGRAPA